MALNAVQLGLLPAEVMAQQKVKILYVNGRRVLGTVNKSRKCNDRCLMAISDECSCECGGANHGAMRIGR